MGHFFQPKIPQTVKKDVYFQLSGFSASSISKVVERRKEKKRQKDRWSIDPAISLKFSSSALKTSTQKRFYKLVLSAYTCSLLYPTVFRGLTCTKLLKGISYSLICARFAVFISNRPYEITLQKRTIRTSLVNAVYIVSDVKAMLAVVQLMHRRCYGEHFSDVRNTVCRFV